MKNCKNNILELLKNNEDKNFSIYSLMKELGKEKRYAYTTVYVNIKTLISEGKIKLLKDTTNKRTKQIVKLC